MGSYVLCSSALAEHPLKTREFGVDLYSAEELCYYIYHNYVVIEEDFINKDLLSFIEELDLAENAAHIRKYLEDHPSLELALIFILREFRYYTETEIHEFQIRYDEYRRYGTAMRHLIKADFLLEHGYILGALNIYHRFDYAKRDPALKENFLFQVRQHMAIAYIRLGLYEEAMQAFTMAWKEQPTEELLRQMFQFSMFSGVEMPAELLRALDPVKEAQWRQSFEDISTKAYLYASTGSTAAIFTKDTLRRKEQITEYVANAKSEYRKAIL